MSCLFVCLFGKVVLYRNFLPWKHSLQEEGRGHSGDSGRKLTGLEKLKLDSQGPLPKVMEGGRDGGQVNQPVQLPACNVLCELQVEDLEVIILMGWVFR